MQSRTVLRLSFGLLPILIVGCTAPLPASVRYETHGNAALLGQFQARDGRSGRAVSFAELAARCRASDVILFGEEHNNVVCNQVQAQLAAELAVADRPLTLALEFFETDTQAALDAYLRGRIVEGDFQELTRQGSSYLVSHRPLIELARREGLPVLAANAPRRLVRGYRRSGQEFDAYRAELEPEVQQWLPSANDYLRGGYERNFSLIMGGDGTIAAESDHDRLYRAQLLWDEAMAESIAHHRAQHRERRVLLMVGSFHVANFGGTERKLRTRRPTDRILTIVFRATVDGRFPFDEEDRGAADLIIYGITPPPAPRAPDTASPHPPTAPAPEQAATASPAEVQPLDEADALYQRLRQALFATPRWLLAPLVPGNDGDIPEASERPGPR
ncbi:MAG: ChaN family lipoprotein [Phycisphaerales bacterium]|nr:ChaN family lipoprotein [Phycisphaerales bacterium]